MRRGMKPKPGSKRKVGDGRTRDEYDRIAERRKQVSELVLLGWTQQQIAGVVGVHRNTIVEDYKAIHEEWVKSRVANREEMVARELESLDMMERELLVQWERSKGIEKTRKHKEGDDGVSDETIEKEQCGNPAYMAQLIRVRERRAALLGLDAPQKVAPTSPDGSKPFEAALAGESTEALLLLTKLRGKASQE